MFIPPKLRFKKTLYYHPPTTSDGPLLLRLKYLGRQYFEILKLKAELFERACIFFIQRKTRMDLRGWDDSDMWELYVHLAKVLYPRLLRFQQTHPFEDDYETSIAVDKMCQAFYMIATYSSSDYRYNDEVVKEGLEAFRDHYFCLWY